MYIRYCIRTYHTCLPYGSAFPSNPVSIQYIHPPFPPPYFLFYSISFINDFRKPLFCFLLRHKCYLGGRTASGKRDLPDLVYENNSRSISLRLERPFFETVVFFWVLCFYAHAWMHGCMHAYAYMDSCVRASMQYFRGILGEHTCHALKLRSRVCPLRYALRTSYTYPLFWSIILS